MSDYGYSLPKLVAIHREYLRSWFKVEWCVCRFIYVQDVLSKSELANSSADSKMKTLGIECQGIIPVGHSA